MATDNDRDVVELGLKVARLEEKIVAADSALSLAREALTRWQATSNEWRQENIDQRQMYLTIDKGHSLIATEAAFRYALEARMRIMETTVTEGSGKAQGSHATLAIAATVITIVISLAAVLIHFIK